MLTIYEQIQNAVDYVERNLFEDVASDGAAGAASMSPSSFHRYFPALTGYRFGEYLRKRRLSESLDLLLASDRSVLEIAIRVGYQSHEAFTRAFKREFGDAPLRFRSNGAKTARTDKLNIVGEVMMGVLTKSLPEMTVAYFDGFRPEPEYKAHSLMEAWIARHPEIGGSYRSFGYNIDLDGNLAHEPENEGYRVMVTVPEEALTPDPETQLRKIPGGAFVVTGIEGSFEDDPTGSWITEGWRRLAVMVERQGLKVHPSGRWFEETLEPINAGRMRFDLYLEIVTGS